MSKCILLPLFQRAFAHDFGFLNEVLYADRTVCIGTVELFIDEAISFGPACMLQQRAAGVGESIDPLRIVANAVVDVGRVLSLDPTKSGQSFRGEIINRMLAWANQSRQIRC